MSYTSVVYANAEEECEDVYAEDLYPRAVKLFRIGLG